MKKFDSLALILNSHVPYLISQETWSSRLDWLYEAAAEVYMPLLNSLNRLIEDGISPRTTLGFSPLLLEMFKSEGFREGFQEYLEERYDAAESDMAGFERVGSRQFAMVARMWREFYTIILREFRDNYNADIVRVLSRLQEEGHLEIITTAATHGCLSLLSKRGSVEAQLKQGVATYRRCFGSAPRGFWLPRSEVSHAAGGGSGLGIEVVGSVLRGEGVDYLVIDPDPLGDISSLEMYRDVSDTLGNGGQGWSGFGESLWFHPYGVYTLNGPDPLTHIITAVERGPGVQADLDEGAYYADNDALDFRRRWLSSGLRYWRVTAGEAGFTEKEEYHPDHAFRRLADHTMRFRRFVDGISYPAFVDARGRGVLIGSNIALLGRRWFEGPEWLCHMISSIVEDGATKLVKAGEYLELADLRKVANGPKVQAMEMEGDYGVWLNDKTSWIWDHIHRAEEEMAHLVNDLGEMDDRKTQGMIRQAAREFMLLQSSDWQLLATTCSNREYAEMRFVRHYEDFVRLVDLARHTAGGGFMKEHDWNFFRDCEARDDIFSEIDPMWFKDLLSEPV